MCAERQLRAETVGILTAPSVLSVRGVAKEGSFGPPLFLWANRPREQGGLRRKVLSIKHANLVDCYGIQFFGRRDGAGLGEAEKQRETDEKVE